MLAHPMADGPAAHEPGRPPGELPRGLVTFLFTDIESSTSLWQEHPEAMPQALADHHRLVRQAIETCGGSIFQIIGDSFCAAFANAGDAVTSALAIQRALQGHAWGATGPIRIRIGLHTGDAEPRDGDYPSSLTLIRAQRVMSAGHGGQILLSPAAADGLRERLPEGVFIRDLGTYRLRGLTGSEHIYQLTAGDLPGDFPLLRVAEPSESAEDAISLIEKLDRVRLVGRGKELEQLWENWQRASRGSSRLILLSGEPGIGKTRLAEELIARARAAGAVVLRGGCYEYEANTPYLPIVEALRDWAHAQPPDALRRLLGATAPEIAKLAPEIEGKLGPLAPNPPLGANEERLRLFDNLARLLQTLAAPRGLVLFVDDLHWVDPGTLSLIHYLTRHLRHDRLLILGAYRELELDRAHPLAAALVDWNRERLAGRIPLGRLSLEETGALLAALFGQQAVSPEFAGVLFRETEGNPFFVEEVIKSLIEQGQIYREAGSWQRKDIEELSIPQSVREAIARRLNRLGEQSTEVLHTAAVLGKVFTFEELAAVSPVQEDALLDALDEASGAQLLRVSGESYAFTHDKIREVLYEEQNPIRRRRLHQRIGEGLEKLAERRPEGRAAELAYHFSLSGDLTRASRYLIQAAEEAERLFAHDQALAFYGQALEAAEALKQTDGIAAIHRAIGDIYSLQGKTVPAVEAYSRALALASSSEQRAALQTEIGKVYTQVGDPRGLSFLDEVITKLNPETQKEQVARALALIGRYHHYRTEHSQAIDNLEQARQLAEPGDNADLLSTIYSFLSGAYQHLARVDESDQWARASIELGRRKDNLAAVAIGNEFLAENAVLKGEWDQALGFAARDHEIGVKLGAQARIAWAGFSIVQAHFGKGELERALQQAEAMLELCARIGEGRLATWLDPFAAIINADLGRNAEAERHAAEGRRRADKLGQIVLTALSYHAVGYYHLARQEWPLAVESYAEAQRVLGASENRVALLLLGPFMAEAYIQAGQLEEAVRFLEEYVPLAERAGARHLRAVAGRVRGQLLLRQNQTAAAQQLFSGAVGVLVAIGSRLELARALYWRGVALERGGDRAGAQADWEQALKLARDCGAEREAARVEAAMSGHGSPGH